MQPRCEHCHYPIGAGHSPDCATMQESGILKKAEDVLSEEDYIYFEKVVAEKGDDLFDPTGKAMHTTNDFYFGKMLESGVIRTGEDQEGMYQSSGASFTDGDFERALTFQTVFDDQNSRSGEKKFNSQDYSDKASDFVRHMWEQKEEEFGEYLSKISGKKVKTLDDAIKVAEGFKFQTKPKGIADDSERLAKLYGVTIVYDKESLSELVPKKQDDKDSDFELLSFRDGGVPISEASTIFVPESQVENVKLLTQKQGLNHLDVRSSEELEVARMMRVLDRE